MFHHSACVDQIWFCKIPITSSSPHISPAYDYLLTLQKMLNQVNKRSQWRKIFETVLCHGNLCGIINELFTIDYHEEPKYVNFSGANGLRLN